MAVSRSKTWISGEVLSASDLNSEFSNILDNGQSVGFPRTGSSDFDGNELILDADGDTSITADTDDRIDFQLSGTDLFRMLGTVATPVNGFDWVASAAGSVVQMQAIGSDTNISINLVPKGTGVVQVAGAALPRRDSGLAIFRSQTNRAQIEEMSATLTFAGQTFA